MNVWHWEQRFPWLNWREPIVITGPGGIKRFACRVCTAEKGLKGTDVYDLPRTAHEVAAHIKSAHDAAPPASGTGSTP